MKRTCLGLWTWILWVTGPNVALATVHEDLAAFLHETVASSPSELDSLASRFNPYQLPLVAAALSVEEHEGHRLQPQTYRAMVRWQYWLGRNLDPKNQGMWGVNHPHPDPENRVSPVVAALELLQLRALTEMAVRRGHPVDALTWWQDYRGLRRRLATQLYDPMTGVYTSLDSLGHRVAEVDVWPSLIPLALGASYVPTATASFVREQLLGNRPSDDPMAMVEAMARLDPSSGWILRRGADRLPSDAMLRLVGIALANLSDPAVRTISRDALRSLGQHRREPIRLYFGNHQVEVDPAALESWPAVGARAGIDLFRRLRFAPAAEVERLATALDHSTAASMPDSTAELLATAIGKWRKGPFKAQRSSLMRHHRETLEPNGDPKHAAFQFNENDGVPLAKAAVSAMLGDLLAHHLAARPAAVYRAELYPPTLAAGMQPELTLTFPRAGEANDLALDGWTAAWTNGRSVRRADSFTLTPVDERTFTVDLPAPPHDLGVWWLVLNGPKGPPRTAPGLSVVESIRTSLAALGPPQPDGTIAYELKISNRVARTSVGRIEIQHPEDWGIEPSPQFSYELPPYGRANWTVHLHPGDGVGPRTSMTEWRVFEGDELVDRRSVPIAIPLRWLNVGPFSFDAEDPLERSHDPELEPTVSTRFRGSKGLTAWKIASTGATQPEGWHRMVKSTQTRGIYYALSALTTSSRDVVVSLETTAPALLMVNGREEIRIDGFKRNRQQMVRLNNGTNRFLVKMVAGQGTEGRFRLDLEDAGGGPMIAVANELENLLDGYAYISGTAEERSPEAEQRSLYRRVPIKFVDTNALSVAVVGSFNGWSPTAHPMVKDANGQWYVEIPLRPGRFEYKLAVDGVRWVADPDNPIQAADGFGGINSVLVLD